ncbi:MAG: hypothetical protein M1839_002598 [Geoglossum umbratile]|nr:MAG: hypothetical protein M1839_002598 [Geoglossum umbratile]
MAAPEAVDMRALSGNKTLSDDIDPILTLQGIGWFMRKAIEYATVTLHIKEYEEKRDDSTSVTHIDIDQTATGGIKGTSECRTLDWTEREHSDQIFGELIGKSRWQILEKIGGPDAEFLATGWLDEVKKTGLMESYVISDEGGWTARQACIWGFEEFEGKRYYARHVVVKKHEEVKKAKLVYDYIKPLELLEVEE